MRIAVLSDVHANLPALTSVLDAVDRKGCERVYHAGDLIAIGPYPSEVVEVARRRGFLCVQGNHEGLFTTGIPVEPHEGLGDAELMHQHWTHSRLNLEQRRYLRDQPFILEERIENVDLTIVHFALDSSGRSFKRVNLRKADEEILDLFDTIPGDLVCFGHIHPRQFNLRYCGRHFLNSGGVGFSKDGKAFFAIVDIESGGFEISVEEAEYDRGPLLRRYDELEIPDREFIRKVFFGVVNSQANTSVVASV